MILKKILFFLFLTCAATAAVVAAPGSTPATDEPNEPTADLPAESPAEPASEIITPDSLATIAAEKFTAYHNRKFDGEEPETLYPAALDLYTTTVETLKLQNPGSRGYLQCKDILRQINDDLLRGAFFYSSRSQQAELNTFARAYLDTQLLEQMADVRWNRDENIFPSICYIAASNAYNTRDWNNALNYFKLYLSTGATERREQVYQFMGNAAIEAKNYPVAIAVMQEAIKQYPTNETMAMIGCQACVDGGHAQFLQEFLTHALALKPNDTRLLMLQGQLYEDEHNYRGAIDIYTTIDDLSPNMLSVAKHQGMSYYNLAVTAFNKAKNEENEKEAKRLRRQARNYFDAAAMKFRSVLETDPTSVKYLRALGVCYLCLEDKSSFAEINARLSAMGQDPLENVFMPPMMSASETGGKNIASSNLADANVSVDAPNYSEFSRKYLTERLGKWAKQGEFEPGNKYAERVNPTTIAAERSRLERECADTYLKEYGGNLRLNNLALSPYNPQDEVFQITTNYGPIVIHVPLKNQEAENFKAVFEGIDIRSPRYYIDEEGVKIASATIVTPAGKSYTFDNAKALAYHEAPKVDIDFNSILRDNSSASKSTANRSTEVVRIQRKSDVDEKIPHNNKVDENRLALIIANENYQNTAKVASAYNDGLAMKEYCKEVLGMPERNIIYLNDATLGQTYGAIRNLRDRVEALDGKAEVLVYYAGHGFPDERSKNAYILPVDGFATAPESSLELSKFYDNLGKMNAASVMVFLDACFSGAQRDASNEMIADARSVVIKPKETAPKGNMMVFSAASGNETALPYAEKNHGLFTYYILKHLQETKGNTTPKELADYVISNVKRQSNFINSKPQTPTVNLSGNMSQLWSTMKMRP